MNAKYLVALGMTALLVSACGSDGDAPAPAGPLTSGEAVPESAGRSAEALAQFITALAAENSEAKEALDVTRFAPASSEASDPVALK